MAGANLFDQPGMVAVVNEPVLVAYARKARVAFLAVSWLVAVLAGAVSGLFLHPLFAVALGLACGLVCGSVAAAVVWVWPVLRVLWRWSVELAVLTVAGAAVPAWLARVRQPVAARWRARHGRRGACRGAVRCAGGCGRGRGVWWSGIGCGCASRSSSGRRPGPGRVRCR